MPEVPATAASDATALASNEMMMSKCRRGRVLMFNTRRAPSVWSQIHQNSLAGGPRHTQGEFAKGTYSEERSGFWALASCVPAPFVLSYCLFLGVVLCSVIV